MLKKTEIRKKQLNCYKRGEKVIEKVKCIKRKRFENAHYALLYLAMRNSHLFTGRR